MRFPLCYLKSDLSDTMYVGNKWNFVRAGGNHEELEFFVALSCSVR